MVFSVWKYVRVYNFTLKGKIYILLLHFLTIFYFFSENFFFNFFMLNLAA